MGFYTTDSHFYVCLLQQLVSNGRVQPHNTQLSNWEINIQTKGLLGEKPCSCFGEYQLALVRCMFRRSEEKKKNKAVNLVAGKYTPLQEAGGTGKEKKNTLTSPQENRGQPLPFLEAPLKPVLRVTSK